MVAMLGSKVKSHRKLGTVLAGVGISLFVFVLYFMTLAPTILSFPEELDSPVLPTAAYVLGIPQATGYPTYMMLTHLFTYLPMGDVAYRVNFASAVFAVLAVFTVFLVGFRLSGSIVASAASALAFGTSGLFWSQAVIAEVHTLNALFIALTILVLLIWRERREDKYLLMAAFLMGLSMTHHLTSGLLLPAGFLFVLLVEARKLVEWRLALKGIGLFLLGLLPYVYLPVRARMDAPFNVGNPSNWDRFWHLVSGAQFKANMFVFGPEELPGRLYLYLNYLFGQFHWLLLMMGIVGGIYLLAKDKAAFAFLGFLYLAWLLFSLEYAIDDIQMYFIPTYLILAIFAVVGFAAILREVKEPLDSWSSRKAGGLVLATLSLLTLTIPLWGLGETYRTVDQSGDYEGRRIIDVVAQNAEQGATVMQLRSSLYYAVLVEDRRKDLKLLSYYEPQSNEEPQSEEEKRTRMNAAIQDGSLYLLFPSLTAASAEYSSQLEKYGYQLVPIEDGVLYRVDLG